ncbi:hypothetical protein VOLCADRAFT_107892, partial [Volvox carteri f. nagariensis]
MWLRLSEQCNVAIHTHKLTHASSSSYQYLLIVSHQVLNSICLWAFWLGSEDFRQLGSLMANSPVVAGSEPALAFAFGCLGDLRCLVWVGVLFALIVSGAVHGLLARWLYS